MTDLRASVIRVGTRGSRLALSQTDHVMSRMAALRPGLEFRRVIVKTLGDKILDTPLSLIGDKGLFTKELDLALLTNEIDLAVHSLKDLPTSLPQDLALGAILEREDPSDVLISASGKTLDQLPAGARIGTSSLRRRSQLLALRADLEIVPLRGNVPTRIEKARRGQFDAIVLARAGIVRLGLAGTITELIGYDRILPAVGQGAIAVECRASDSRITEIVAGLDHPPTHLAVVAERALLRRLEGGCQVPIGALGRFSAAPGQPLAAGVGRLTLDGLVAGLDGEKVIRAHAEGDVRAETDAAAIGTRLAERLLDMGARAILDHIVATARPLPVPRGGEEDDQDA